MLQIIKTIKNIACKYFYTYIYKDVLSVTIYSYSQTKIQIVAVLYILYIQYCTSISGGDYSSLYIVSFKFLETFM